MKKFKYLFIFAISAAVFTSCSDDEDSLADQISGSPNYIGFVNGTTNFSGVADGRTIGYELPLFLSGPNIANVKGDVTIEVSVDVAKSTAKEGTHFSLESKTFTLTAAKGYRDKLPITMLTDGIETPLAANPVIVLNISSASSADKVIASSKPLTISMLYLCPSDLAGDYALSVDYYRAISGGYQGTYNRTDTWNETGDGQYRTTYVGYWTPAQLGGEPGFDFIDVCDAITIPSQNLVNLYSNIVEGVAGASSRNEATGVVYMEYTICASDCREFFATYTPL